MGVRSNFADRTVEGAAGAGDPILGNPVPLGYKDGSGNIQYYTGGNVGGANLNTSHVTATTAAATLAIARPTRRSVTIKNTDTSLTVYVGEATVTAAKGMEIKAGESWPLDFTGLIQVIAASGTPVVDIADVYD